MDHFANGRRIRSMAGAGFELRETQSHYMDVSDAEKRDIDCDNQRFRNPKHVIWECSLGPTPSPTIAPPGEIRVQNSLVVEALYRVKRALVGHISYLAACDVNTVFSEYILYETVIRALSGQGFTVICEVPCDWLPKPANGDWERIDFLASKPQVEMAIEVKWEDKTTIDVQNDLSKLALFLDQFPNIRAFLCVFGVASKISTVLPSAFTGADADRLNTYSRVEVGRICIADLCVTRFSCRVFEIKRPDDESIDQTRAWDPA